MGKLLWELEKKEMQTESKDFSENGFGEHPIGMPSIDCSICGPGGGGLGVLPFYCPEEFTSDYRLYTWGSRPTKEFNELRSKIEESLLKQGIRVRLRAGDNFQPLVVDFLQKPAYNFLWPGIGHIVVTNFVKELFSRYFSNDVSFTKVINTIAKDKKTFNKYLDDPNHQINMFRKYREDSNDVSSEQLFEMHILSSGGHIPGSTFTSPCPECGDAKQYIIFPNDELVLEESSLPDNDIFYASGTYIILITDKVRRVMIDNGFDENCKISPVKIID